MEDFNGNILEILTEWDNNPREMWVWDNGDSFPQKKKVIFLDKQTCIYPVVTRCKEDTTCFQCCADIIPEPEKKFRPYKSITELISNFCDKVNRSVLLQPLPSIWVKNKITSQRHLITDFCGDNGEKEGTFVRIRGVEKGTFVSTPDESLTLKDLYDDYVFFDDSPCGMEVKE